MSDKPQIILSGSIDEKATKKKIQEQIKGMSKEDRKILLNLHLDETALKKANKQISDLEKNTLAMSKNSTKNIDLYNKGIGKTLEVTQVLNHKTGQLEITQEKLVTNFKEINKEVAKLNAQQSKAWENRFSENLKSMTAPNAGLKSMSDYYRQQEKTLGTEDEFSKLSENLSIQKKITQQKMEEYSLVAKKYRLTDAQKMQLQEEKNSVQKILDTHAKTTKEIERQNNALKLARSNMQSIISEAKITGRTNLNPKEYIGGALQATAGWFAATTVFYQFVRAIQGGFQSVLELDKAMTELSKTAQATDEELKQFAKDSYDVADALASTNIEVIEATSTFSKMGYTLSESLELGKLAVKLQTVGDGMGNMESTANSLVAVLKGFGVDENSAVAVATKRVDQLNQVSNDMAVSTGDITAGLERSSAAMAISGNSFEQTTALLVAGTEVLRNSEMVARGLVTSSQRIYDQGAEALDRWGIATVNANGSVRSTFEILTDLHEIFPMLTEDQKRWTLTQISGKDQFKTLSSVMQNWNSVAKTMESQLNANGSATDELNRKLNSLEGRLNKFTNAMASFWTNAIDSDIVKGGMSLVTGLVDSFNMLNVATSGALVPIALIGVVMKTVFGKDIITLIYKATVYVAGLSSTAYGASTAFQIMNMSLKTFQITLGVVGIALVGLSAIYNAHVTAVEEAKVKTEEFEKAQKALTEEMTKGDDTTKAKVNELTSLVNKYDELIEKEDELKKKEEERNKELNKSRKHERDRSSSDEYKKLTSDISKLKDEFTKLGTTVENAKDKIELGNEALKRTNDITDLTTWSFDQLSEKINKTSDSYSMLEDAQIQLDEQGYLSQATIEALTEKYGDFITTTGLSKDAIVSFINTEKEAIKTSLKNDITLTNQKIENAKERIKALLIEQQAAEAVLTGDPTNVSAMHKQYASARGAEPFNKMITDLEASKAVLNNAFNELGTIESKSDEKDKKKDKDKITLLTELEKKLLDNASAITILREKQNLLSEDDVKRLTLLNDEIKLNKERQSLLHQQAEQSRKELSTLQSKSKLTDKEKKQIEDLQANLRGYGEEWHSVQSAINSSQKAIEDFGKKAKEEIEKKQEELAKFTIDLTKQVADALEKQDEERLNQLKSDAQKRIDIVDAELEAIEKAYKDATEKMDKDDLNEKISELNQERNMLAIEGSLDANARIYEIDKELVDLNKQLKENERKSQYEKDRQRLEDRKKAINKELELEEDALKKRNYMATARIMIEEGAMNSIVNLLKQYDSQFALDGQTKGQAWVNAFMAQVGQVSSNITNTGGSGAYGSGGTGGTYIPSPTTGGISSPPSAGMVQYETGGVNDYTGLAQLDGSKTLPEVVLNSSQISNIAGSLGISGSPARMAHGLYNMAKSGVKSMGDTAVNVVMNVNAVINNSMDIADVSKQLAVGMNREIGKRGIRLNG